MNRAHARTFEPEALPRKRRPADRRSTAAIAGAAGAALSKGQKRAICIIAREAWNKLEPLGLTDGSFTEWRRAQQAEACGTASLRAARNADFRTLKAHFLHLVGRDVAALRLHVRAAGEPREQAMAKLRRECGKAGDVLPEAAAYARGFVRNKRGVELEEASARDIWHAVFTVRRRAGQLRKQKGGAGA